MRLCDLLCKYPTVFNGCNRIKIQIIEKYDKLYRVNAGVHQ